MDSSLFSKPYTQSINDFKNMPRICHNTSTALTLFDSPSSLAWIHNAIASKTDLSLLQPFLSNTAAREILLKNKSDHATQILGQAPHHIQSKHYEVLTRTYMILPFHLSSLTSPTALPSLSPLQLHLGLCCSINMTGMLCSRALYGLSFCLQCSSSDTCTANSFTFFNLAQNVLSQ